MPVYAEVEDGLGAPVTVIDETPMRDPTFVAGDVVFLTAAVTTSEDGLA